MGWQGVCPPCYRGTTYFVQQPCASGKCRPALAMGAAREYAGTASAMLGAICFSFGGIVSPLVGIGDTLLSTGAVFIVCALCSWLSLRIAPRHTAFAAA